MENQQCISKLDASMIRCGVSFIFSYQFKGRVNKEILQKSAINLLSNVPRLQKTMLTNDTYNGYWQEQLIDSNRWFIYQKNIFDKALTYFYQTLVDEQKATEFPGMFFVLVAHPTDDDAFMLLQCGKHSYCDGSSATLLFNQFIKYYNAALQKDTSTQQQLLDNAKAMISPEPNDIYSLLSGKNKKWLDIGRWRHIKNTARLMTYKTEDTGQFATPHDLLPEMLAQYKIQTSTPQKHYFDAAPFIKKCRQYSAEISPNTMVLALVAKAMSDINKDDNISFRVMVDILNVGLRKKIFGNYIAYLPITVNTHLSVENIAVLINKHLYQAKFAQQDVSMYKMLEFALGSGMANKTNDPVSYIISNINNVAMQTNPEMMTNAICESFEASANAAPIDVQGAQLNNRPTLCYNLAHNSQLYIGFFNTLTSPQIAECFLTEIKKILNQYAFEAINNIDH